MVEFEKGIVAEIRKFYEGDKPIEEAPLEEQFEKFAELLMLSEEAKTECPELFYWQGMCEEFGIGVPLFCLWLKASVDYAAKLC